jgi:TPR repeat protein
MKTNVAFAALDKFFDTIGVGRWEDNRSDIWKENRRWEYAQTEDMTLWNKEECKAQLIELRTLLEENPEEAFRRYIELAESGSAWAMCMVASCYVNRAGTAPDYEKALHWYRRSSILGNRHATLDLRRLLERLGDLEQADAALAEGVTENWAPALFWHAWYGLRRSDNPQPLVWARPFLERAADQGSPAAQWILAREMAHGRLGYANIPRGWKLLLGFAGRMKPQWSQAGVTTLKL